MTFAVGTDIGGTFTDTVVMDEAGQVSVFKVPSTPRDNAEGVLASLELAARGLDLPLEAFLSRVGTFFHGTTVGLNAVLTRSGAKVGVLTTRGFRDTLPMMRASRTPVLDALKTDMPALRDETTLVPAYWIEEVTGRIDAGGNEVVPLDLEDVKRAAAALVAKGVEALAVCLLWSFRNPDHEERVRAYLHEAYPGLHVSLSSHVMPVIREYERSVATVVDASIAGLIERYLGGLEQRLRAGGLGGPFFVMQSAGGALSVREAAERPCQVLFSGPAGGVTGAQFLGQVLHRPNLLTMDMGGTSCDIGVIVDGRPNVVTRSKVLAYDAALAKLDIITIGAGGGSIAYADRGVFLRVGPRSAGAEPGPACYDRGGTQATVTDANVLLGYIDPAYFLDGRMEIRRDLAEAALARLGAEIGLGPLETAIGIVDVTNANMVNAIRNVSLERGHDPRDFVLVCFGGAGPLHAGALLNELQLESALVPTTATAQSAYGFLCSDICHRLVVSRSVRNPSDPGLFNEVFASLRAEGTATLAREGVKTADMAFTRYADMKYCGQIFEIPIEVPDRELEAADLVDLTARFEKAYETLYGEGTGWKDAGVEIVNFRLDAVGKMPRPALTAAPLVGGDPERARKGERSCYFASLGGFAPTAVYRAEDLAPGMVLPGPAIVAMPSTSAVVQPDQELYLDEYRNAIIRKR